MIPQELLRANRAVYVLADKPGIPVPFAMQYWYLDLDGLHPEQIKSSVARLRDQKLKAAKSKADKSALKATALQDSVARALGAKSYEDWLFRLHPELMRLLAEHDMTVPTDLIKWAYAPGLSGALSARQVSDRIFNSGLSRPARIFTGVGSRLFAPSGFGRHDINDIMSHLQAWDFIYDGIPGDDDRFAFCREHSDDVLLVADRVKYSIAPAQIPMTGRSLMLNSVSEYVGSAYNMLGDNLVVPSVAKPEFNSFRTTNEEDAFDFKIYGLFREEIERSDEGWVDVISVPGSDSLVLLKGKNGTFDWVVRDQREGPLTINPLYPFFKTDEVPTAMGDSRIAAYRYFKIGEWEEKLMHDAEKRHYSEGGDGSNWPGYDKLIEREFLSRPNFKAPSKKAGRPNERFFSHRVRDYRLMVSPLVTIDQFTSFLTDTDWARTRLERAHEVGLNLERDLSSMNAGDSGELPVSVTWLDAIAYCRDYERRSGLPVRLLEPEEWVQIAPEPTVDRSRVVPVRTLLVQTGQREIDPIYEQLKWAVIGGDGRLGKNSADSDRPDGTFSFVTDLHWSANAAGLPFLSVAGFCEWLSGYQEGYAPFAEAGRGYVSNRAGIFSWMEPAHKAMRHEGAKVGFRLCYVAHPDA